MGSTIPLLTIILLLTFHENLNSNPKMFSPKDQHKALIILRRMLWWCKFFHPEPLKGAGCIRSHIFVPRLTHPKVLVWVSFSHMAPLRCVPNCNFARTTLLPEGI